MVPRLKAEFERRFGASARLLSRAPGRVNLIGEHVDYNGGPVLPVALDRELRLAARPSGDDLVILHALDLDRSVAFRLRELSPGVDVTGSALPGWARYPAGVAWALLEAGLRVSGVQVVYASNLPRGAGLASSAAVEVAFAVLWQALGGWSLERMDLARLCQRAENEYVGVACGLMDQFASACGVEGHAIWFDTRSLEWQTYPLPEGTSLVIADSGIRRRLAESAYNQRRADCERAVELLRSYLPAMQTLRDITPVEFAAYSEVLPPQVRRRAEHVVKEIARVGSAVNALQRSDARVLGALLFAGHASLRDLYEVSLPELDALVEIARTLPGCLGARLTGAGFGGCTVNLVEEAHVQEFNAALEAAFHERTGRQARVYLCRASAGASLQFL